MNEKRFKILKQATLAAGKIIRSIKPDSFVMEKEGRGNFVTKADLESKKNNN